MDRTLEITKLNMFVRIFILPIIVGILVGILTKLGQGILPGNWHSLANLGSVWLVPSFSWLALVILSVQLCFLVSLHYSVWY